MSFDKKLAELDAYLQMLIVENESLDKKLTALSSSSSSSLQNIAARDTEREVLLQIAKVSSRGTDSSCEFHSTGPRSSLPSPPRRPVRSSKHSAGISRDSGSNSSSIEKGGAGSSGNNSGSFDSQHNVAVEPSVTTPVGNDDDDCRRHGDREAHDEEDEDAFFDAADEQLPKVTNNNNDNTMEDGSIDWDAMYEEEEEEELDSLEGQGSVIKHLLSQIRIGMDLTKVVLPTFILERRSLLEMYADFFAHPDLFSAITDFETPEERMVQLVKWYLSAFHAGRRSSVAKKPYNPILGEIFRCNWRLIESNNISKQTQRLNSDSADKSQELMFVAEQVSHHPPVSAFYAENKAKNISCCAHIYTKSKYLGLSVGVHNLGQGVINVQEHNETYVCTFPSAYGRSILTVPWVELGGSVNISCEQTGYKANIEFVTKPFYGGKKHRVTGEILRPNNEPFVAIDGEWNGVMYGKRPPNSSRKEVFVDTTNLPVIKKHVKPISAQETFESRNVWKEVTRALKIRDVNSATAAKSYIEQRQRDLLKDRQEKGAKWKTRFFEQAEGETWRFSGHSEPSELM